MIAFLHHIHSSWSDPDLSNAPFISSAVDIYDDLVAKIAFCVTKREKGKICLTMLMHRYWTFLFQIIIQILQVMEINQLVHWEVLKCLLTSISGFNIQYILTTKHLCPKLQDLLIVYAIKNHPFGGTWSVSVCTNSWLDMFRMLFDT